MTAKLLVLPLRSSRRSPIGRCSHRVRPRGLSLGKSQHTHPKLVVHTTPHNTCEVAFPPRGGPTSSVRATTNTSKPRFVQDLHNPEATMRQRHIGQQIPLGSQPHVPSLSIIIGAPTGDNVEPTAARLGVCRKKHNNDDNSL
ncbi:unnamed protein product [Ectocarpus sp. 8 AP-2014]